MVDRYSADSHNSSCNGRCNRDLKMAASVGGTAHKLFLEVVRSAAVCKQCS